MKLIYLNEPAACADCGRQLPAGYQARYYNKDKIYCNPPCSAPPADKQDQGPAAGPTSATDAVLVFLERIDVALRELINNLAKK